MSPFSIITAILFIGSSALAAIFAVLAKQYKLQLTRHSEEKEKLESSIQNKEIEHEEEMLQSTERMEALEQQVSYLMQEKEDAFEKGRQTQLDEFEEDKNQKINLQQLSEKFELELSDANKTIESLKQQTSKSDNERNKILLEELNENINWGQSQLLSYLESKIIINDLALTLSEENNFVLGFDEALSKTGLQEEKHFLSEKFKISDDSKEEKTLYVILFAANGNVVLIDGKFSAFIEQNIQYLDSNEPEIKEQIRNIITERADFLANPEFQTTLKATLEELDNIRNVNSIQTCVYLPTELAITKLSKSINDFSEIMSSRSLTALSPAGFVNVLQSCKFINEIEQEIIKYQVLADIVSDFDFDTDENNSEQNDSTAENSTTENNNSETESVNSEDSTNKEDMATLDLEKNTEESQNVPEMIGDLGMDDLNLSDIIKDEDEEKESNDLPDQDQSLDDLALDEKNNDDKAEGNETNNIEKDLNLDDITLDEETNSEQEEGDEINNIADDLNLDNITLDEEQNNDKPENDEVNNSEDDLNLDDITLDEEQNNDKPESDEINNIEDDLELDDITLDEEIDNDKPESDEINNIEDGLNLDDITLDEETENNESESDEVNNSEDDLNLDDTTLDEVQNNDELESNEINNIEENNDTKEKKDQDNTFKTTQKTDELKLEEIKEPKSEPTQSDIPSDIADGLNLEDLNLDDIKLDDIDSEELADDDSEAAFEDFDIDGFLEEEKK